MATPFDRLMMTIRPHLPGAIDNAIKVELFGVCQEFFDLSNAWQEVIEFTAKAKHQVIEVLPTAGKINRLMAIRTGDGQNVNGAFMISENHVKLPYEPAYDTDYKGIFAIIVSDPVARDVLPIVPYEIIQRYTQELIHGVLAAMMVQPQKPWTDVKLAGYHQVKFTSGAARARHENNVGNTYGSQRWLYPQTYKFNR